MTGPLLACSLRLLLASPLLLPPAPRAGDDSQVSSASTARQCDPVIRVDPSDPLHMIAAAEDDRSGKPNCAYYATFDGGLTWTENVFSDPQGLGNAKSPGVAFGPNGATYFVASAYEQDFWHSSIYVGISDDGGATIPTWVAATKRNDRYYDFLPELAVDDTGGAYAGNLYLTFSRIGAGYDIWMARSQDGGLTWGGRQVVSDSNFCDGSSPVVGLNGELFVGYFDYNDDTIKLATSTDGGTTFGTDVKVCDSAFLRLVPHTAIETNSFPHLAIDRSGGPFAGTLYLCLASDQATGTGADIWSTRSTDGGATWSNLLRVNDDATSNAQFFPGIDVDVNGRVNVAFFDRREDPKDVAMRCYVARSSDGGATWRPNRPAADVAYDPTKFPQGAYLGDSTGVSSSDRTIHAIWTDGRNGDEDVFTSPLDLDLQTDSSSISAATGGTVKFTLDAGPLYGGVAYWILGSVTGTSPGMTFHGVHVPIDFDAFTLLTIVNAGTSSLPGFAGTLGASGDATASLVAPLLPPALIGLPMDFAFLVRTGGAVRWASDPTHVEIVP